MLKADNIASIQQYFLAVGIAVCLILVLIVRFFQLQILDYDQYSKKANTNRIRKVTASAPEFAVTIPVTTTPLLFACALTDPPNLIAVASIPVKLEPSPENELAVTVPLNDPVFAVKIPAVI